jgi:tRNA(Glu) U13 pseudouridine synthase TruD
MEPLDGNGLRLSFTLPKGSYATALLDELCGNVDLLDEGVDDA